MTAKDTLSSMDLAALLCSRVCHDIISPVGAITNGLEVLEEDNGEDMRAFAMELITKSAHTASAKLQFARLAFGAAGSAGAEIDTGDAEKVASNFMAGEKADMEWEGTRVLMPKNLVKLLLNLVLIGTSTIPRGGTIKVKHDGDARYPTFLLVCEGRNARIPASLDRLLRGKPADDHGIDAHAIQPYYTGLLARESKMDLSFDWTDDTITIEAKPVYIPPASEMIGVAIPGEDA
ncbi:histidine phosphotransferase ChpT [Cohaesibacter gelatinilyticus]|uniref:Histidine phosphotransferase ChpT n=1 Tax=Cohaesibacter gelatinilyticus TaxID=372072 RepID=A0A285PH42_9HYPH|nr:histidine phosphotransferase family protein [Cohaesibacter gelatinilyticus]SNZ21035.1 histidine phosphotransferase ChpT [Cohaesibacter gelatinilyticus]HAT88004.1 histidine phosphotransferase [Hyphomicrobiales bacterium]